VERLTPELPDVPVERVRVAAAAVGGVAILAGVILAYHAVDLSSNHLARTFSEDILASLEPGTILLADGDHVVLPLAYLQAVENQRPDVTLVILGIRGSAWYMRQLRQREATLVVPTADYRRRVDTLRALADANPSRKVALFGPALEDTSLEGGYWLYRRGLV